MYKGLRDCIENLGVRAGISKVGYFLTSIELGIMFSLAMINKGFYKLNQRNAFFRIDCYY
jgi:hypothetical protein